MALLRYRTLTFFSKSGFPQAQPKSPGLSPGFLYRACDTQLPRSLSFSVSFSRDCAKKRSGAEHEIRLFYLHPPASILSVSGLQTVIKSLNLQEAMKTTSLHFSYRSPPSLRPPSSITQQPSLPLTASFLASRANVQMTFRNYKCC